MVPSAALSSHSSHNLSILSILRSVHITQEAYDPDSGEIALEAGAGAAAGVTTGKSARLLPEVDVDGAARLLPGLDGAAPAAVEMPVPTNLIAHQHRNERTKTNLSWRLLLQCFAAGDCTAF